MGLPIAPEPKELISGNETTTIHRCSIQFDAKEGLSNLAEVHGSFFPNSLCSTSSTRSFTIQTEKTNSSDSCSDESYELNVTYTHANLRAPCYKGIVWAYSTLINIFDFDTETNMVTIESLPIQIKDSPRFPHRGIMLDTARHFINKETILRILNSMILGKINVLHWHISDDESFPMESKSYPELAKAASYGPSMIFSRKDVSDIVAYAKARAIRVIPEIDNPGHTRAFGLYPPLKPLLTCFEPGGYSGGAPNAAMDPTMPESMEFVKNIFGDLIEYFDDNLIHLGGDEVRHGCWDRRPAIKEFMRQHNISDYSALLAYYLEEVRKIIKGINPAKEVIQWISEAELGRVKFNADSVLQFWGTSGGIRKLTEFQPNNKVILSPHDFFYLDCGYENYYGGNAWCGNFKSWTDMYYFEPTNYGLPEANILGGETCAWAEVINNDNLENKLWPRSLAYAAVLWEPKRTDKADLPRLANALNNFNKHLEMINARTSPITGQYCELNAKECFQEWK